LESIRIARNAQDPTTIASILTTMGQYYTEIKDYTKAKETFAEAYDIYKKFNWKEAIAYSAGYYGKMLIQTNELDKAKELLKSKGYYVGNLWNTDDVTMNFDCTEEEAHKVLDKLFSNEYVNQQIQDSIKIIADSMNLKHKE
jgi:tetratricopeptide (TPR) repeat protein